ncbi:molybdate ABC transporter substrate-binding protein [Sulfitobacter sp. TMED3]|uniref:molybdate ABC transporter substrate-binding protein n=1 Tax=Sulfitobacter sp. TMED3 TaxID=1986591 RepID=UPI000B6C0ADC|nr:molybdate ABC transporter substrate-binding protein [Sulfitobacter sp. TMED3]MAJ78417.1 molybdate ABC transporter substrate-binding protein [Roseobacter sp.]OUT36605.1 MAG: molybdate ABC transporter substrate-binding protein [Sulfitobacter sp. TMED3]
MKRFLPLIFAALLPTLTQAEQPSVTVFAAASLRGSLDEVARRYDGDVALSFGGSGTMARQIDAGAPADVVLLAAPVWMTWLRDRGAVQADAVVDLLGNSLVVIAPADSNIAPDPADLAGALGDARLAMGQRDAVPAGIYAREWLEVTGQWDAIAPHLAETDNVRSALALVARAETPLGVVYRTDALAEPQVRILYDIPQGTHSPITYPAAALSDSGAAFMAHLQSDDARAVFARHGFKPLPE